LRAQALVYGAPNCKGSPIAPPQDVMPLGCVPSTDPKGSPTFATCDSQPPQKAPAAAPAAAAAHQQAALLPARAARADDGVAAAVREAAARAAQLRA